MKLSLCTCDYSFENFKPVINLICRDENGERWIIKDHTFLPYFYTRSAWALTVNNASGVLGTESGYQTWDKFNNLTKIYTSHPVFVRDIRRKLEEKFKGQVSFESVTYEADILFELRYLIDKNIKTGIEINEDGIITPIDMPSNYKILFLDIETYSDTIPDLHKANHPIIAIGMFYDNKYYSLSTSKVKLNKDKLFLSEPTEVEERYYDLERELLDSIGELLKELAPDIIVTFSPFDLCYLFHRMKTLNIGYFNISPLKWISLFEDSRVKIKGIQFMDLSDMHKTVMGETKWETLDEVSKKEIGYGKLPIKSVYELWKKDPNEVLRYNLRDVELIKEIEKKCTLIKDYFDPIRRVAGSNLSDTMFPSRIADIMYLRLCKPIGALPTKTLTDKKQYSGAVVRNVVPSIMKNIVVFDFHEMYPNIIETFNIGYNTFIESGDIVIDKEKGYAYRSDKVSWTTSLLKELRPLREIPRGLYKKTKELKYKRQSDALKAVINAIYGFYGYAGDFEKRLPAARLYSNKIAESITIVGKTLMEEGLFPLVEKLGYSVVYGDTDSCFIALKTDNSIKESSDLKNLISKELTNFIEKRWNIKASENLTIDTDKIFKSLVCLTKKRYDGITIDGERVTKGIEQIRRDQSILTAEIQSSILNMLHENCNKEDIIEYLRMIKSSFKSIPIGKIAIAGRVSKPLKQFKTTPVQVQALLWAREYGIEIKEGERFLWVYLIPNPHRTVTRNVETKNKVRSLDGREIYEVKQKKIPLKVVGFKDNFPDGLQIDYNKMLEKTVTNKIDYLISLKGIKWSDI